MADAKRRYVVTSKFTSQTPGYMNVYVHEIEGDDYGGLHLEKNNSADYLKMGDELEIANLGGPNCVVYRNGEIFYGSPHAEAQKP